MMYTSSIIDFTQGTWNNRGLIVFNIKESERMAYKSQIQIRKLYKLVLQWVGELPVRGFSLNHDDAVICDTAIA